MKRRSSLVTRKDDLKETAASPLGGVHKPKTLGAHRLAPVHKLDVHYSARREPHYSSRRGPSRFTRNSASRLPILGITMGDPAGIGPEVIVKALAGKTVHRLCRPLVIGSHAVMEKTVRSLGLPMRVMKHADLQQTFPKAGQIAVLDPLEKPLGPFKMGQAAAARVRHRSHM